EAYLLAVIGVGLFVSSLARTQQQAILYSFTFMVPAMLLSGFASPIENMPGWLPTLTIANPVRHLIVIVHGVFRKDLPAGRVGGRGGAGPGAAGRDRGGDADRGELAVPPSHGVARRPPNVRSARRAPDADGAIVAGGGDAPAVGEERHADHGAGVAFVVAQLPAARRIPDAHGLVGVTAGDDALAVRRTRDATGAMRGTDPLPLLARLDVPDVQRPVAGRRQQALAVRREADAGDAAVSGDPADLLAGAEIPQVNRPIKAARYREF